MNPNQKTLAVVGLGYVGLPLALLADKKGYRVHGIDINPQRVDLLNQRIAPFRDEEIERKLPRASFEATANFDKIREAEIIIICVPTPVFENHLPNLEPLKEAAEGIAKFLQKGSLVVLESTVNPGVSENILLPILENISGFKAGVDFYLAHCPERINPGDKKWRVENIPRVIGSLEPIGLAKALEFYRSILEAEVHPMDSIQEAEAVKIVENSFRDINIAFVNELAMSFSRMGIDAVRVIDGAATKPFAFMPHYPGCGVGGHCIPVDPYYLIEYARQNGFRHDFLELARKINNQMPHYTVEELFMALHEKSIGLKSAKVAVLGLAYKSDIDDTRESPAFEIIKYLRHYDMDISVYDPYVPGKSNVGSLEEALDGRSAAIIATAHSHFRVMKPKDFLGHGVGIVIDGRNCLDSEDFRKAGINYKGIGRR